MYSEDPAISQAKIPPLVAFEAELGAHYADELAGRDDLPPAGLVACGAHVELLGQPAPHAGCGRGCSEFGPHGFRAYVDHNHPEICTPLCPDALSLVRWQRRLRELAVTLAQYAARRGCPIRIHTATTNRKGAGWGWHGNILVDRKVFDHWRDAHFRPLMGQWVPFLVTAPILFGTGKLGAENGRPAARYQLSQRADFISEVVSLETVETKALINTRDEPWADARRFARFHIAGPFEFNLMPYAAWLKFGCTQLMIALLSCAAARLPDLKLADPLASLATVSRDLALSARLEMADGSGRTALEIQESLVHAAARALQDGRIDEGLVPDAALLVDEWARTLRQLARRDPALRGRLDWVARLDGIQHARRRLRWRGWDDPRLLEVDLRYGALDGGWFEQLEQAAGVIARCEDFLPPAVAGRPPVVCPRDAARLALIKKFPYHLGCIDWDGVCLYADSGSGQEVYRIVLTDPLDATAPLEAIAAASTVGELIRSLPKTLCVRMECGEVPARKSDTGTLKKETSHERPAAQNTAGGRPA